MESHHIVKTRSLNTLASAPRQKTTIAHEPKQNTMALDSGQNQMSLEPREYHRPNPTAFAPRQNHQPNPVALEPKPDEMPREAEQDETPREARPNHRRIYIAMRVPQARDELKEIVEAMQELRAKPKPLIKSAEDRETGRQIVYCRERMKEIRGEIQRLVDERRAIAGK